MRYNLVYKAIAPTPPYSSDLVCLPVEAIPHVLGALWLKSQKYWWAPGDNAQLGRQLLAEEGANLLMPCGTQIVNAIDRLYTLHDATFNGIVRTVEGTGTDVDPFVYTPALVQSASPTTYAGPGIKQFSEVLSLSLAHLITGLSNDLYAEEVGLVPKLEEIRAQLEGMGSDDEAGWAALLDALPLILAALA